MKTTFPDRKLLKDHFSRTLASTGAKPAELPRPSRARREQDEAEARRGTCEPGARAVDGFFQGMLLSQDGSAGGVRSTRLEATERQSMEEAQDGALAVARKVDPTAMKQCLRKYKYFSRGHMKMSQIHEKTSLKSRDLFTRCELAGDVVLDRAELRRVFCTVQPALSDIEVKAIFDTIDGNRSGQISVHEFRAALEQAGHQPAKQRHQIPGHCIRKLPPANIEGFELVSGYPEYAGLADLCEKQQEGIMRRTTGLLQNRASFQIETGERIPKYRYFSEVGDSTRFRRRMGRVDSSMTPRSARSACSRTPGML